MTEQPLQKRSVSRLVSLQHEAHGSLFVLSPYGRGKEPVMARFVRETELLRQTRHPHLLRGVQDGADHRRKAEPLSGGWPGDAEWLATLSLRQRLRLFAEVASAVGGLHRAGVVYGVLHPDRIGIRANGEAVLLDLGMTWLGGVVRGGGDALDYCAPECFSNRVPDARADIYSLGLLLHYLLTGTPPSVRNRGGQAERLPALPDNLADLQPLLTLMLVEQPAERPSSVTMLLDQLNALVMRSARLAGRLEADRDVGELPFERLLTPLSALSQRPALVSAGVPVDSIEASRWDAPTGTGRWSLWALGLGIPLICGVALVAWLQTQSEQELGLIEKLVLRADTQLKEGKLLLPAEDNALDTLRTLRIADPANAKLSVLSERIEDGAGQFVLETLRQGRLDEADLALIRAIRAFPDDPRLVELSGTLAQARREAEERDRLNRLVTKIDAHLKGQLDTPEAVDSIIALLRRAQDMAGENVAVTERRMQLEKVVVEQARFELQREHLEQAKESMDRLRELAPGSASLAGLEAEYRRLLGAEAHRKQLAGLLKDAAAAEKAGADKPAGLRRALEAYLQVLRLEPDDVTAKARVQKLGEVALNNTRRAVESDDWGLARDYLAQVYRALPDNGELAALDARIAQGAREQSAEVRKRLDQADLALRRGNFFVPEGRSAWDLYQSARAYPQSEAEVNGGLRRLRAAVLKEVDSLIAQRRYDHAGTLVERARQHFSNDSELGRRKLTLASILEQRKSQSVVADGVLTINAIPWAYIHSVKRAGDRQRIALENDATTPLRLKVPAGDYLIELRNPDDGRLREIHARVQSGKGTNVSVSLRGDQ